MIVLDLIWKCILAFLYGLLSMFSFTIPLLICVVLVYLFHDRTIFDKNSEVKPGCMLWVCLIISLMVYGILSGYIGVRFMEIW